MNMRPRRPESPRVDITPLIDVVFLMLIFFMVSTTFDKQSQLKVNLPSAEAVEQKPVQPDRVEVTIDAKGYFYVNEHELVSHDVATLRRALEKSTDGHLDIPVIVTGDRKAPLQAMITVMDVAAQLGMSKLSVSASGSPDSKVQP